LHNNDAQSDQKPQELDDNNKRARTNTKQLIFFNIVIVFFQLVEFFASIESFAANAISTFIHSIRNT
jgi:hypothetical protein